MERRTSSVPLTGDSLPEFTPLSTGLGLGTLRATPHAKTGNRKNQALSHSNEGPTPPLNDFFTQRQAGAVAEEAVRSKGSAPLTPRRQKVSLSIASHDVTFLFTRMVIATGIDVFFVFINLFVGLAGAIFVAYFRGEKAVYWTDLYPIVWVTSQTPTRLVCGIAIVYLVYVLAFLLVVGSTIGYMSLGNSRRPP